MSTEESVPNVYLRLLGVLIRCLVLDRVPILAAAIALAVIGGVFGKLTNSVTSSAQLLLTPLPLRTAETEDEMTRMLADPMDIITASKLCTSDETIQLTFDKLNASGRLASPIEDLVKLRSALDVDITISVDTPYETIYSPVLTLSAKGGTPEEAKLMVDTWAQVCAEMGERYKKLQQKFAFDAFHARSADINERLREAEDTVEQFWRENNLQLIKDRLNQLVGLTTNYLDSRAEIEQNMIDAESKIAAYDEFLASEEPKLRLNWVPSGRLLDWAGTQFGVKAGKDEEASLLSQEQINPVYMTIHQEISQTHATVRGQRARLVKLDSQLEEFAAEMKDLQAQNAQLQREEKRLSREALIIEHAYKDAALKAIFAQLADQLDQPGLQFLSGGAEWRMPRFRRAILFGAVGGMLGFFLAASASVAVRAVVRPALEQAA